MSFQPDSLVRKNELNPKDAELQLESEVLFEQELEAGIEVVSEITQKERVELDNLLQTAVASGAETDINEVEQKISNLFSRTEPSVQPILESSLLADKEFRRYEYNKRVNQLRFLADTLEDEESKKVLQEIVKLIDQDTSFFDTIDTILEEETKSAFRSGTYNSFTNVASSVAYGAYGAGASVFVIAANGIQSMPLAATTVGISWGLTSGAVYLSSVINGYRKKRKQEKINNQLEGVGNLFDPELIDFLINKLSYKLKTTGTSILLRERNNIDYTPYTNSPFLPAEERKDYEQINAEYLEKHLVYSQMSKSLGILENIEGLLEELETSEVLPNIEFLNEFTNLVNEIYRLGGDAKNIKDLANNVIDSYLKNKASITNNDLIRLIVRSGLSKGDTDLNRQIFTSDLEHILNADYIKFLEKNDQNFRHNLIREMTQKLKDILPFNDKLVRYFLSKDVEEGTLSSDYRSDYKLEDTSIKEILKLIENSQGKDKQDAVNFYKQKNEFEQSRSMIKRIPWLLKSKFYKKLLKMGGYTPEEIAGLINKKD